MGERINGMLVTLVTRACGCRVRLHYLSRETVDKFRESVCSDCRTLQEDRAQRRAARLNISIDEARRQIAQEAQERRGE